jgi:hypothetical protein
MCTPTSGGGVSFALASVLKRFNEASLRSYRSGGMFEIAYLLEITKFTTLG